MIHSIYVNKSNCRIKSIADRGVLGLAVGFFLSAVISRSSYSLLGFPAYTVYLLFFLFFVVFICGDKALAKKDDRALFFKAAFSFI